MRTVTFSNPKVAEEINAKFVPVWYNRGRGFHNCELRTEKWIFESSGEAYPTKNICTFFMTADLKVVHYVSGYYAPEVFLEILASAERLQVAASGADFSRLHRGMSDELSKRMEEMGRAGEGSRGCPMLSSAFGGPLRWRDQEHRHGRACAAVLKEAFAYFKRVHEALAADGPVPLEKVQHTYLFGNSFTEEAHAEERAAGDFPRPQTPTERRPSR